MEVGESLAVARDAVEAANLPEGWQISAFTEVLRHLMSGAVWPQGVQVGNAGMSGEGGKAGGSEPDTPASRLAARVKVTESTLLDVFEFTEADVTLHVASSRIPTSKSRATQDVALLIAAARQGSGLDSGWTSADFVRDALQHYNRYDQSNFSANLKGVDHAFNSKGRGSSLELRLTQPGWESAIALIRHVAGVTE